MFSKLFSGSACKINNLLAINNFEKINCVLWFPGVTNFSTAILTSNSQHDEYESKTHKTNENNFKLLQEQKYFVKLKNDPDSFGMPDKECVYEEDVREEKFLENPPTSSNQLRTKEYADIIKALLGKKKIKEAIDVLEVKMLQEDKVKPENYIYNLVLGGCGRVGYTKKAFSLYNQMKKRALKVTPGTYTALFNACANSPWPEDGLKRATHLRNIISEKMYEPNGTNYNAMIKAFGRCGDLNTAFLIADEMISKNIRMKDDTVNFLLQACITDKEAGFRHSLLVWRKCIDKNIKPTLYSYNLMLRCIRDCGFGDVEITKDVINRLVPEDRRLQLGTPKMEHLSTRDNTSFKQSDICDKSDDSKNFNKVVSVAKEKSSEPYSEIIENRPNLMAKIPHLGSILSLGEVTRPEDRLLLVGGCSEFLKNMSENNCEPDIKTFTQLVETIPGTLSAEKDLLRTMIKYNVKPDTDFYNMLIKKRSMRFDYNSAEEVLDMIEAAKLKPNIMTYGILALGSKTKEESALFIQKMRDANYRLNSEILGSMLYQACYQNSFPYILELMDISVKEQIKPNKKFMLHLQEFKKKCNRINKTKDHELRTKSFIKNYHFFKKRYETWLNQIEVDESEDAHPWQQFRQTTDTDTKFYKDKATRFEARHTSLFRQKKNYGVTRNIKKRSFF